jgi:hypothetical protein
MVEFFGVRLGMYSLPLANVIVRFDDSQSYSFNGKLQPSGFIV